MQLHNPMVGNHFTRPVAQRVRQKAMTRPAQNGNYSTNLGEGWVCIDALIEVDFEP